MQILQRYTQTIGFISFFTYPHDVFPFLSGNIQTELRCIEGIITIPILLGGEGGCNDSAVYDRKYFYVTIR